MRQFGTKILAKWSPSLRGFQVCFYANRIKKLGEVTDSRHPFEGFRFVSTSKNKQKNYFQISRHPFEGFRFVSTNGGGMFDTTTKESPSLRGFQVCFYSKPPRH